MTSTPRCSSRLYASFLFGWCLLNATGATADDRFDQAISQLVVKVSKVMNDRNVSRKLVVGSFSPPPRLQAVGGVSLQQRIIAALKEDRFEIVKGDAFQLRGSFTVFKEKVDANDPYESAAIKIEAQLLDDNDREVTVFSINVFGDTVLPLSGATVALPANIQEAERQALLVSVSQDPPAEFPGTINSAAVRAAAESPFAIEVHVLKPGLILRPNAAVDEADFVPLLPELKDGHPTLLIPRDRPYIIKLTNNASFEAAAGVYIDTLSMFAFSDSGRTDGHVIVPPGGSAYIKGWFRTLQQSNAFSVGAYSQSAAGGLLINESNVGSITATFAACWETQPPADEAQPPKGRAKGDGTRIDKPIQLHYEVRKRHIGKVRAAITVQYNR